MNVHAQIQGQMLIGGEMVAGEANQWIEAVNPANGLIADTSREHSPSSIAVIGTWRS